MAQSRKWLAALAVTGSAAGAGFALSNAPGASATAAPSPTAIGRGQTGEINELGSVETEANQLHSMIARLRQQVEAEQSVQATASADSGKLQTEQAQLAGEASQLRAEQASLAAERQSLAASAAKLEAEQQQLAAEAKQLSTAPATHTTTGASGAATSSEGGHDD